LSYLVRSSEKLNNKTIVLPGYLTSEKQALQNPLKEEIKEEIREIAFMLAKELSNAVERELKKKKELVILPLFFV